MAHYQGEDSTTEQMESEPLWPITVDIIGLPGAGRTPTKISVEVNGHTHVGNLCDMLSRKAGSFLSDHGSRRIQLVWNFGLADVRIDWSNYALWWPSKNVWLLNGSFTLDNWEISARDQLEFAPKLYTLQLILPDLQVYHMKVDYSKRVFEVVKDICKKLCQFNYFSWLVKTLVWCSMSFFRYPQTRRAVVVQTKKSTSKGQENNRSVWRHPKFYPSGLSFTSSQHSL